MTNRYAAVGKLSSEQISAYRRLAKAAVETASARLARKIGGLAGDRIRDEISIVDSKIDKLVYQIYESTESDIKKLM